MHPWPAHAAYAITPLAFTGEVFAEFAPYVASVNEIGQVAFQAALRGSGSGVFVADGNGIRTVASTEAAPFAEFTSHPDLNDAGQSCFYARTNSGTNAVFLHQDGATIGVGPPNLRLREVGPLGPVIDRTGKVAYRATLADGNEAILLGDVRESSVICAAGKEFAGFEGLPIPTNSGVVFTAKDAHGGRAILLVSRASAADRVASTGDGFRALGNFVSANDEGDVVFSGAEGAGPAALWLRRRGVTARLVEGGGFQSVRGGLVNGRGDIVFFAGDHDGRLGVFAGPDAGHCILRIGSALLGAEVAEFAANHVSFNAARQLALRVRLTDGRGVIVRADPQGAG